MTESTDRELEAILKLIELTQDGTIVWSSLPLAGDLKNSDKLTYTNIMGCEFEKKHLRLYSEKILIEQPTGALESLSYAAARALGQTFPYWSEKDVLEITNGHGQSLWRFAYKPAIKDLLNAAKYQVSGVKDFLDAILRK